MGPARKAKVKSYKEESDEDFEEVSPTQYNNDGNNGKNANGSDFSLEEDDEDADYDLKDEEESDDPVEEDEDFDDEEVIQKKKTPAKSKQQKAVPSSATKKDKKAAPKTVKEKAAAVKAMPKKSSNTKQTPTKQSKAAASKGSAGPPTPTLKGTPQEIVLDYLRKTNRPYSMLNIFDNLHKAVAKPAIQKALDSLVESNQLKEKVYGKAKIYYYNQDHYPDLAPEEQGSLDGKLEQAARDLETVSAKAKALENERSGLLAQPTDEDLVRKLDELESLVKERRNKVDILSKGVQVSPGKRKATVKQYDKYRTQWVARKRIAMDFVEMCADRAEKKPKQILEEVGAEADEDIGVTIPPKLSM